MDRKDFFKTGLSETAKSVYNSKIGGIVDRQLQSFANLLAPFASPAIQKETIEDGPLVNSETAPITDSSKPQESAAPIQLPARKKKRFSRPPGSVRDPERFRQICTACGDCIVACPYGAILRVPGTYGPVMNPNLAACALCEDYPCIQSCDEQALLPIPEGFLPKFGHAVLNPGLCRNVPAVTAARKKSSRAESVVKAPRKKLCKICVDSCPVPDAISLLPGGIRIPSFAHHCTGCGLCVHACPENAIKIEQN